MIRIDDIWLATEPLDMRAGADTILARVVKVFGSARPHHAYLFANRHDTHEGPGVRRIWHLAGCTTLEQGSFRLGQCPY
ncbi:IS66 family insertion sequence element accessory protein TnpB [Caballeronia sordidicola]|uniref:IS66 family insertion sequence element accessory protein TnpB n=1 Tax=Caballeronia sordidicola TaxID=196367 RepID=UPI00117E9ABB|nr:IS66 family insertion sequence element accessory protein TnpB [Caballeronia sordidicola]